jgi:hypothetical protein
MTQSTFVEIFLVKYAEMDLEKAEKLVREYSRRFPIKGIAGICGYIKYQQKYFLEIQKIVNYVLFEMRNAGLNNVKTSTESYWVEMGNDRMPSL